MRRRINTLSSVEDAVKAHSAALLGNLTVG
jgi:hypothetical protein